MTKQSLLIELGTEELPPKPLAKLSSEFGRLFQESLEGASFSFDGIEIFASPRRLALRVKGLEESQPTQKTEKRGPAVSAAKDGEGNLTKAVQGFMRSVGAESIDDLDIMETDKGQWFYYQDEKPGQTIHELLEGLLTTALGKLPIERRMRWGASRSEFVRPVHWLVTLFGEAVVPCNVLGVQADRKTTGHRFMSSGQLDIPHADDYESVLKAASVIASFAERRESIREQLQALATELKGEVIIDESLLDEVTALVEWPVALAGKFDEKFLSVPEEVLISAMKSHQRYFHLVDQHNRLMPAFITVANIESRHPEVVIAGNERVITPRLTDADFFYQQDQKTSLAENLDRLKQVVFQKELGTYHQKAERVSELAGYIAKIIGANEIEARRAGLLCKCDLVSDMVGEFPELQGLMGSYYARNDGEADDVSLAIKEHYLPVGSGGDLPKSLVGACVAIADKLDTIIGLFGIGQPPSGSRDPFALRRQTLGIIRICIEMKLPINLAEVMNQSASLYGQDFDTTQVLKYFVDRLGNWYQDQEIRFDTFAAIRESRSDFAILTEVDQRVAALETFRSDAEADSLVAGFKRITNILKKLDNVKPDPDEDSFAEEAESLLLDAVKTAREGILSSGDFVHQLSLLAGLRPAIDRYFDDVMVMADDEDLKNNRLATLALVQDTFLDVADLSQLQ